MKKILNNQFFAIFISIALLFSFTSCGNSYCDKLIGTWSVSTYKFQGKICTKNEITKMFGSTFNDAYGQTVMVFNSNNTVDITAAKSNHHIGTYDISDDVISIYYEEKIITDLKYQNNSLELKVPDTDVSIIFKQQ